MKLKYKNRMIIYIILIIFALTLIISSIILNHNDNTLQHNLNVNNESLFVNNISEGLTSNLKCDKEQAWDNAYIHYDDNNSSSDELNFVAKQYCIEIHNNLSQAIAYYNLKFTANQTTLMLTFWSGKDVEVHQYRDGNEIVENFQFDNHKEDYEIETIFDGEKDILVLKSGDYFIYKPSYIGWEMPISSNQIAYPGFICFQNKDIKYITPSIDFIYPKMTTLNDDININFSSRNEIYGKKVDEDAPNFVMDTYDIHINNNSTKLISKYKYQINIKEKMYFSNMWDGQIEVCQNNKIQKIENPRELKKLVAENKLDLKYIKNENDIFVELNEGDYIIFSSDDVIYPNKFSDSGIILIYPNTKATPNLDVSLSYYINNPIIFYPTFWIGIAILVITIIPIIFELIMKQKVKIYIAQKNQSERIVVEAIETFTSFIDAKDPYTKGHSNRVSEYAMEIAKGLNLSTDECKKIYYIALMHDCGKIGIPDNILTKPGKLTKEEYDIIKTHTTIGYDILKNFNSIEGIRDGVLYHHERYDEKGYPEGIKGEQIPLIARIICVADSFDAMTSNRCYRKALSKDEVINELKNNRGTQFDPKIVDVFLKLIEDKKIKF